ncbi:putative gustatory receptor 28b [Tribolium madens]|uniref:putative gustatory receptor 28b n=1 Tax=Tribolium madens TaxID=41895 RepID=UPI001CF73B5A|nr:putative gustatory receptor 28b [Tribolium madens]
MARKNANQIGDFVSTAQMIDKKFKNMGFAVDYSTGRRQTQIFAGVLIFKIVLQLMPFYFLGTSWSLVDFLDFIVYNLPAFVVYVCSIQWITHIAIIRLQFKTLNKILKILRYQPPWFVETYRLRKKKSISSKILIRECGTFYDALCIQSGKINNAFAVQVLLIISMLLMLIIFDSFQTCRMIQNLTEFDCGSVVYNILYFETLMELVLPCVLIESEADRFSDNLHKINNNEIEDVVHLLILQSCYQRIEFSICGIFTLSGKFIYSIFGAMTTFLIMLLQFEL